MNKVKCPLCSNFEHVKEVSYNKLFDNKIYLCSDCPISFDNPMPSLEELDEYYGRESDIRHKGERSSFTKAHKLKRWRRAYEQYDYIKQYFKKDSSDLLFVDFGCGLGNLISLLSKSQYRVIGIEPNIEYRKNAPINIRNHIFGDLIEADVKNSDVVLILSHVLEHLNDPSEFLDHLLKHLKVKYIFVQQPLIQMGYIDYLIKKKKLGGEHIIMFSENSLNNFFKSKNFIPQKKIKTLYTGLANISVKEFITDKNLKKQLISSHKSQNLKMRFYRLFERFTIIFLSAKQIAKLTHKLKYFAPEKLATSITNVYINVDETI